jgi:hypothetical protein
MIQIANHFWERFAMHAAGAPQPDRFLLWIDSVGGYWVCLGDEITLGQPSPRGIIDVPILGDISACHARLRRDGEGFLVEAIREVSVDGRAVRGTDWLRDGSEIQLGPSVRLLFRKPHALSGTVRLEFLSRHRTQPSSDAVLWMADSCVLGPKRHSHVVCRNWSGEVTVYRDGEELFCRAAGRLKIDGAVCDGRGRIARNSSVQGEGFSFKLELLQ